MRDATQTAAPPIMPPRRPIVAIGMADGEDWRAQFGETRRQVQAMVERLETLRLETQAQLDLLRRRLDR